MFTASFVALAMGATSVLGADHTVLVGSNSTKTFTPSELTAAVGDTVTFSFVAGNHTATQSTFAAPCTNAGFASGFIPGNTTQTATYSILVNDTTPIWVYCAQTGHCADGMVMSINAATTGNKTFAAFQAAAMGNSAATNTTSGDSTSTGTATSTKTGKNSKSSSSATDSSAATSTKSSKSSSANGTTASDTSGTSAALGSVVFGPAAKGVLVAGLMGVAGAVAALL